MKTRKTKTIGVLVLMVFVVIIMVGILIGTSDTKEDTSLQDNNTKQLVQKKPYL